VEGSKAVENANKVSDYVPAELTPELARVNSLFFSLSILAVILGGIIATTQ
jgi:hypothetical protein